MVKKEIWKLKDTFNCLIFAFFFSLTLVCIAAMMETMYLVNNEKEYDGQAPYILFPILICLIFITIYPLIDFLFMAKSKSEISVIPIQRPFEKWIKSVPAPYSYFMALGIYFLFFVFPLILFFILKNSLFYNVPFYIFWTSWMLIYPMLILCYYASIGYVIGFWVLLSRIPNMKRSTLLAFDSSDRAFKEFLRDPMTRIVWGTLIWTYIYLPYIVFRTLRRVNINFNIYDFVENYPFEWYLPIAIAGAFSTFFSRYWQRKVKVSSRSILFSAFLIAAVSVNILVNFTTARPDVFESIYLKWDFTSALYDYRGSGRAGPIDRHTQLNIISVIEELSICVIINYYFLIEKGRKTIYDILKSEVKSACEKFNPIPGFNMIRYKKIECREYAKSELMKMYERIPHKQSSFTSIELKDPLMDAICDPTNIYARQIGKEIFIGLIDSFPDQAKVLLEEGLKSSNIDKIYNTSDVLLKVKTNLDDLISKKQIFSLIKNPDNRIKINGIKILVKIIKNNPNHNNYLETQEIEFLINKTNNSNYLLEIEYLYLLQNFPDHVPIDIFLSRLNSSIPEIQSVATEGLINYSTDSLQDLSIEDILKLLNNPNEVVISSTLRTIGSIGNFNKNKISHEIFLDYLLHPNHDIRNSAIFGLKEFLKEKPKVIKSDYIINLLNSIPKNSEDLIIGLLDILSVIWNIKSTDILPVFVNYLKSPEKSLSKISQEMLVRLGTKNPKSITRELLQIKDTKSFIKHGKIAETLIRISKNLWQKTLPVIYTSQTSEKDYVKQNCAILLKSIINDHPNDVKIINIIEAWKNETEVNIRKEYIECLIVYAKNEPEQILNYLEIIFNEFIRANKIEKPRLVEIFDIISGINIDFIKLDYIEKFVNDENDKVREKGIFIVGKYLIKDSSKSLKILIDCLEDKSWAVQNTAAETIAKFGIEKISPKILRKFKLLLKSTNKWTRRTAIEIFSKNTEIVVKNFNFKEIYSFFQTVETDPDNLKIGLRILANFIDDSFDDVFNLLIKYMQNGNSKIREGAIAAMIQIGLKIKADILIPKLLLFLTDETDIFVQESVAKVLNRLAKYENEKLKNRVITVLRLRVNVSPNQVLTDVLTDLEK